MILVAPIATTPWMEHCWKRGSDNWTVCCFLSCSVLSQLSVCLSFAVKSVISFRGSFSCQSFALMGTYLSQSGVCVSSSFSCQVLTLTGSHLFHWQSGQSICFYLSPLLSQPFLLLLICLCWRHSFLPLIGSLGQPWSRISAAFCVQPVYTTVSACIHRHIYRYSCFSCL